jgi:hypothetical protein
MENSVVPVQLGHETNRKPRGARSPSSNRSQALREGYVVDGSGCGRWLQRFLGMPVEEGVETRKQAAVQASSRQIAQAVRSSTDRVGRCVGARHTVLGVCAGWMDRTFGARHNPATVRRGISSGICAAFAPPDGLESAEAGAASPRTERSGHRPLASRILAATKKRASSVKRAWFFSTKAGFCCNRCGGVCGHRGATRPCNVPGIDAIESRRLPPSPVLPGRCGWVCTTNSWTIMRGRRISFGLCAKSTDICVVRSFWCGIACLLIVPQLDNSSQTRPLGFKWNGFRRMRRTSIPWRMSGISLSTGPWPTSFRTTFTIYTPHSIKSSTPFDTNPTASTRFLTQLI